MRLIYIIALSLAGCTATPRAIDPATRVRLGADPHALAVSCGGYLNDARLPNYPLQSSSPKCSILANPYMQIGDNKWRACNTDKDGNESCASDFIFTVTSGVTP